MNGFVGTYMRNLAAAMAANTATRSKRRQGELPRAIPPAKGRLKRRPPRNGPCPCGRTKVVEVEGQVGGLGQPVTGTVTVTRPVKFKHCHGAPKRPALEKLKDLCFGAFPNHFGNYLGKREPRPAPAPLTPADRFARLWAAYQRA